MEDNKEEYDFGKDAILIARVSTPEQVLIEDASPQIEDLKKWAKKEKYDPNRFKIINSVESGFLPKDKKNGWNIVEEWIKENPTYKTIICTEMSRLSRKKKILRYIQSYIEDNHIQLIIKDINNGFRYLDKYGEVGIGNDLLFTLFASLSESEMKTKRERFRRGLTEYRKRGYSIGGKQLFGYTRVEDGTLKDKKTYEVNKQEAEQIIQVFKWYAFGIDNDLSQTSTSKIALRCKSEGYDKYLHNKRNVNKLLKEEAYLGVKTTNNTRKNPEYFNYKNEDAPKYIKCNSYICKYPQIVDKELFEIVSNRLATENTHNNIVNGQLCDKSSTHISVLAKILKCRFCESMFISDYRYQNGEAKFAYRCGGGRALRGLRKCEKGQSISMRMVDSAIWSFVRGMVQDITTKQRSSTSDAEMLKIITSIENLREGYPELDRRVDAANKIFERMFILGRNLDFYKQEYEEKLEKIEKDRQIIDKEISALERKLRFIENAKNQQDLNDAIEANIQLIESSKAEMAKYVHLLIKEIIPLSNQKNYLVLRITAMTNFDEALNYENNNSQGLPQIIGEKHDGIYYLIIKKDFHSNYELRVINDNLCNWNSENDTFFIGTKVLECYTAKDIFDVDYTKEDPTKLCSMSSSVSFLDFHLLNKEFYKEDINNKEPQEREQ